MQGLYYQGEKTGEGITSLSINVQRVTPQSHCSNILP